MPHYRFNVHDRFGSAMDGEGLELPDLEAARGEAVKGARSMIADDVLLGNLDLAGRIDVTDAGGTLLLSVSFAEAAGGDEP